eukprot:Gb_07817 [translate_table: standard]
MYIENRSSSASSEKVGQSEPTTPSSRSKLMSSGRRTAISECALLWPLLRGGMSGILLTSVLKWGDILGTWVLFEALFGTGDEAESCIWTSTEWEPVDLTEDTDGAGESSRFTVKAFVVDG